MLFARSIQKLHLQYRLLISEMNSDINMLRIFEDHIKENLSKKSEPVIINKVDYFKNSFIDLRKEIDDLRNVMHQKKMKLFALSKEKEVLHRKIFKSDNHDKVLKQFKVYRKKFDRIKKEFLAFVV